MNLKAHLRSLCVQALVVVAPFVSAWAGPGAGGGGGAVLCLNPDQTVKSARLIDLVETEFYEKNKLSKELESLSWQDQLSAVVNRLAFIDPNLEFDLRLALHNADYVPFGETAGTDLVFPSPQDLSRGRLPPIHLGCQIVGAALYVDGSYGGDGYTVSELVWKHLPNMDKAALILHEVLYRIYRHRAPSQVALDSAATRAFVGALFSDRLDGQKISSEARALMARDSFYQAKRISIWSEPYGKIYELALPFLDHPSTQSRPLYLDKDACKEGTRVEVTRSFYKSDSKQTQCSLRLKNDEGGVRTIRPLSLSIIKGANEYLDKVLTKFEFHDSLVHHKGRADPAGPYYEDMTLICDKDYSSEIKIFCGKYEAEVDHVGSPYSIRLYVKELFNGVAEDFVLGTDLRTWVNRSEIRPEAEKNLSSRP